MPSRALLIGAFLAAAAIVAAPVLVSVNGSAKSVPVASVPVKSPVMDLPSPNSVPLNRMSARGEGEKLIDVPLTTIVASGSCLMFRVLFVYVPTTDPWRS